MFHFKSKVISKPQYTIDNIPLIDLNSGVIPKDVSILYKGKEVNRIYKTSVRFWNSGKKTINKDDIVPENLCLLFNDNSST